MEAFKLPVPITWVEPLWVTVQILLILLAGYITQRFVARCLTRLGERYPFPPQLLMPLRGGLRWLIMGSALIFVLERLGVSATVLWTALSGFVAVAAVAFFAMWSVLSNLLYTSLIEAEEAGTGGVMVQVPNSLFFQRSVRRWRGSDALSRGSGEK